MNDTAQKLITSPIGRDIIKYFETFQPAKYTCPAGRLTIGYGHVILPFEDFPKPITIEQADEILTRDLSAIHEILNDRDPPVGLRLSRNPPPYKQHEFDALASFIFNCGSENYLNSTLRRHVAAGLMSDAAEQLPRWVYATVDGKKTQLRGLVRRRAAERRLFETGIFDPKLA
ncbi:MAG: lysozyme [Alphaproteobacteria bacterium]|nr:lysozyme [Alphaproteobacteria bacterium]